jgi:hypothetical protein
LTATFSTIERTTISNRRLAIQAFSKGVSGHWTDGAIRQGS